MRTPGYCNAHDPAITTEDRRLFGAGNGLPRLKNRIKLSSAKDILQWVEDSVNEFAKKVPPEAMNAEVLQVYGDMARVALACVKEMAGGKKSVKTLGWRASG